MNNYTVAGVVYGLSCSCDELEEIRYVGLTTKTHVERLRGHINESTVKGSSLPKAKWIRKHKALGHTIYTQILQKCSTPESLARAELDWIDKFTELGYDLLNCDVRLWSPLAVEVRERISTANRGKTFTEERRARISAGRSGKGTSPRGPMPLETRAKISAAKKGVPSGRPGIPLTDEQKAKIRAANLGKTVSAEVRAKISVGNRGKVRSSEARERYSAATKARWEDPEYRARVAKQAGWKHTDEAKAKMRAAKAGKPNRSTHNRWHVARGMTNPRCFFCTEEAPM